MTHIDKIFAARFTAEWLAAWNEHNLDRVLAHYTDDFEMSSPIIKVLTDNMDGCLRGKAAVREYWARALQRLPDLQFEYRSTSIGVASIAICYLGAAGKQAIEVFSFNTDGLVYKAHAHYSEQSPLDTRL